MKNIIIEKVSDINSDFSYLEVFLKGSKIPFLEIGISVEKQLIFKFYASKVDIAVNEEEWEYILSKAKEFLPRALKNEDDFLNFTTRKS